MKLTEKQLQRIIIEAIEDVINNAKTNDDNNQPSDEELLINASVDDIDLEIENDEERISNISISVLNHSINIEGLIFQAEIKQTFKAYQLHIILPPHLRRQGIMTKLYQVFLVTIGDIVSLYSNRVGEYAKTVNSTEDYDSAIDRALITIADRTNANIEKLSTEEGQELGIIVSLG